MRVALALFLLLALALPSCKPAERKASEKTDAAKEASPAGQDEPAANLFGGRTVFERLLGRTKEDEQLGALAADKEGNVYVSANHETANDAIIVARINADGTLGWAKTFDGPYSDRQPDSGQNGETGGAAGAIAYGDDGFVYVTGTTSWSSSNNSFYVWVAKLDPADGALRWSKLWSSAPTIATASQSSVAYALDATSPGRVFVTGGTDGESQVLVLALEKADGSLAFGRKIELAAGYNDRGYAVRYMGAGALVIGGQTKGDAGFLLHLSGVDGASPALDWAQRVELGTGSSVNAVDVDEAGNAYVSFDLRGAHTTFGFGSFDPKGALRWAKTYGTTNGDKRNANVVTVANDVVYVGGRTAELEDKMGDGLVVGVSAKDGSPVSSLQYFGGKGPNELAEHRVKGLALVGGRLIVGMQVYTANSNPAHYWGQWFEGTGAVADFADGPVVKAIPGVLSGIGADAGGGVVVDVVAPLSADWSDATALKFQDPRDKGDGVPPDADVMVSVIELKAP